MACNKMKKLNLITYLLIAFVFFSCTTSRVIVNVQRPADITVPQHIKNVVLANRSLPSKENRVDNIIEGLFSGEGIGADRKGSEYCIFGLAKMLNSNERYSVANADGMQLRGTGTSVFEIPLDWNQVNEICKTYNADALIVLETFDSDSRIFDGPPRKRRKKVKGVKVVYMEYPATLTMEIESGWRIYDAKNKKLVDENKFTEFQEFTDWGSSPEDAKMHLPSKRHAVKDAGIFAGQQFGFRISPIWIRVNRYYYIGKHDDLKRAKQFVKNKNWDAAISIWKGLTTNSDNKIARRACFNMALASEIKGGLGTAIDWARKAQKLGEKKAHVYINTLNKRKIDEEKLKKQIN